jgi:aspartyl protease family protein
MLRACGIAALSVSVFAAPAWAIDGDTTARAIYLSLILGFLVASLVAGTWVRGWAALRYAALWLLIGFALVVAYTFRPEATYLWNRIVGTVVPGEPWESGKGAVNVRKAQDGHFHVFATVNGQRVEMLVDTGASTVVFPVEMARDLGVNVAGLSFTTPYETANGRVMGADFRLDSIEIGGIVRRGVRASVVPNLGKPLLGMSFINSLSGYGVTGETLTLRD